MTEAFLRDRINFDECELGFPSLKLDLSLPLVLDLDGTLFTTDTLHEALILLLKLRWRAAWKIPLWILQGRAVVKAQLGAIVREADIACFPCNPALLAFAEREARLGRPIVMATAADRLIAEKVGSRFPFISKIISSDGHTNLRGRAKADELARRYPTGFIYAGDSYQDIPVWKHSSGAVLAGVSPRLAKRV